MGPIGANVQPNEPGERRERFDGGILRLAEHCVGVLRAVRAVAVLGHRETPAEPSVSMQSRLFRGRDGRACDQAHESEANPHGARNKAPSPTFAIYGAL